MKQKLRDPRKEQKALRKKQIKKATLRKRAAVKRVKETLK